MKRIVIKFIKIQLACLLILAINFIGLTTVYAFSGSEIVTLANASRNSEGIARLTVNSKLATAAYNKANDMLEYDYFAHTSPMGKTPWDFIKAADYNYIYAGENLSIGYTDAQELHNAWMNSPSHRENIMNGNFKEIGIAVVSGEYEGAQTTVVVQMFGMAEAVTGSENNTNLTEQKVEGDQTNEQLGTEAGSVDFTLVKDRTSISPSQLFVGEETNFTVTYTGEVGSLIAKFGNKEIDLSDNTKISTNANGEKVIEKKVKIETAGDFSVTIEATDLNNKKQSLDLGTLKVAAKEVINSAAAGPAIYQFKEGNQGKIFLYVLAGVLMIVVGAGSLLIYRYAKSQRQVGI